MSRPEWRSPELTREEAVLLNRALGVYWPNPRRAVLALRNKLNLALGLDDDTLWGREHDPREAT